MLFTVSCSVTMRGAAVGAMGQGSHLGMAAPDGSQHTGGPVGSLHLTTSMRAILLCQSLYPPTSLALRISVCLFLLRIVTRRLHRNIIYGLLSVVCAMTTAYLFVVIFQCTPPSYYWKQVEPAETGGESPGTCMNPAVMRGVALAHAAVSALSTWVVGLLPIVVLWGVRMELRTKVTVIVLLGMSIV